VRESEERGAVAFLFLFLLYTGPIFQKVISKKIFLPVVPRDIMGKTLFKKDCDNFYAL
jgi:hypothetical protein